MVGPDTCFGRGVLIERLVGWLVGPDTCFGRGVPLLAGSALFDGGYLFLAGGAGSSLEELYTVNGIPL